MTVVDLLKAARELISVPERWTRKAMARDRYNAPVLATSSKAVCWCLDGALLMVGAGVPFKLIHDAEGFLTRASGWCFISWQDHFSRTHAEVMAMCGRAIALAEAEFAVTA